MIRRMTYLVIMSAVHGAAPITAVTANEDDMTKPSSVLDITVKDIDGKDVKLSQYKGDVLLIVNVASK